MARTDLWRVGAVPAAAADIVADPRADRRAAVSWLPADEDWRYVADPFGVWRDGVLHVFVEAFDYRIGRAHLERWCFEPGDRRWTPMGVALKLDAHLSYPCVFEHGGRTWMIPEAWQSGEVVLWQAREDLSGWTRETVLLPDCPGIDATPYHDPREGLWWLFYTLPGPHRRDRRELHAAWAGRLTGPWHPVGRGPIRDDASSSRPAGAVFIDAQGRAVLPVQDCRQTYGGAVRGLHLLRLLPGRVELAPLDWELQGAAFSATHQAGCHTLTDCGDWSLVDVKTIRRSWWRHVINVQRGLNRRRARPGADPP